MFLCDHRDRQRAHPRRAPCHRARVLALGRAPVHAGPRRAADRQRDGAICVGQPCRPVPRAHAHARSALLARVCRQRRQCGRQWHWRQPRTGRQQPRQPFRSGARLRALLIDHGLPRPAERGDTTGNAGHGTPGPRRQPLPAVRAPRRALRVVAPSAAARRASSPRASTYARGAGLDAGGVTRELFSTLSARGVDPSVLHEMADGSHVRPRGGGRRGPAAVLLRGAWPVARLRSAAALDENGVTCPLPLYPRCARWVDEMMRAADAARATHSCTGLASTFARAGRLSNAAAALCEEQLTFVSDDDPPVEPREGGREGRRRAQCQRVCAAPRAPAVRRRARSCTALRASAVTARGARRGARMASPGALSPAHPSSTSTNGSTLVRRRRIGAARGGVPSVLLPRVRHRLDARCDRFRLRDGPPPPSRPGGKRLAPPFTLCPRPVLAGRLPVAHTCFNASSAPPAASSAGAAGGGGGLGGTTTTTRSSRVG